MTTSVAPIEKPSFDRILIVRLSSMGDIVHSLPAAALLRETFPQATLGWMIEERWVDLLCALSEPRYGKRSLRRPLVEAIHTVNLKRWRSSLLSYHTGERIAASVSDLRSVGYQLAIDLQGALRSAILARWSGAPVVLGAAQPRENLASMWYTRKILTQGTHVVEGYCELVRAVTGNALSIPDATFPCDASAEKAIDNRLSRLGMKNFVILNPGAGWGAKQWPAARYGEVARSLAAQGFPSIINYGPREESLARTAESASADTAKALTLPIGELIALIRRARLFIGGDTGPLHLAAALKVPVVALFGPTDPARNGPFATRRVVLRNPKSPTSLTHCHQPDPGLLEITVPQVVAAALQLLESPLG